MQEAGVIAAVVADAAVNQLNQNLSINYNLEIRWVSSGLRTALTPLFRTWAASVRFMNMRFS